MISLARRLPSLTTVPDEDSPATTERPWDKWLVWLVLAALCFVFFGQPTPDVNESHYLPKAKQFWDSNWCPGDLFLGSADAHWLFFATTGWVTHFVSLEWYAWLGRFASWLLFAFAWLELSRAISPRTWLPVLTLPLFFLFNLRFHLAGEWVVGGFEGKSLAYGFGVWALATWLTGHWPRTILLLGAAIGFHALAGLWLSLAIGLVTVSLGPFGIGHAIRETLGQRTLAGWIQILAGVGLAIAGLLPGLLSQSGANPEQLREAAVIQVTQRLSHHLWFSAFPTVRIALFALLTTICLFLSRRVLWPREIELLFRLATAGLFFNLAGLCLSAATAEQGRIGEIAFSLLRFYWFRFADLAVPLAVTIGLGWLLAAWHRAGNPRQLIWITRFVAIFLISACGLQAFENWQPGMAAGDIAALERYQGEPQRERDLARNWRQVCEWVAKNTPADARFITPAKQQTFKWHAGRCEVVCWKDMPQDPASIIEWADRISSVYRPQIDYDLGLLAFDDEQLRELGAKYGADYLLLPQAAYDRVLDRCALPCVYPEDRAARVSYVILKLKQP